MFYNVLKYTEVQIASATIWTKYKLHILTIYSYYK